MSAPVRAAGSSSAVSGGPVGSAAPGVPAGSGSAAAGVAAGGEGAAGVSAGALADPVHAPSSRDAASSACTAAARRRPDRRWGLCDVPEFVTLTHLPCPWLPKVQYGTDAEPRP